MRDDTPAALRVSSSTFDAEHMKPSLELRVESIQRAFPAGKAPHTGSPKSLHLAALLLSRKLVPATLWQRGNPAPPRVSAAGAAQLAKASRQTAHHPLARWGIF